MGINFLKRSQTKTSPTKAVMYIFVVVVVAVVVVAVVVDKEVKKLTALGTRLPTKTDILKVYYYTSKIISTTQLIQIMG